MNLQLLSEVEDLQLHSKLWDRLKEMKLTIQDFQEVVASLEWKQFDMIKKWEDKNIGIVVEGVVLDGRAGVHQLAFNHLYKETPVIKINFIHILSSKCFPHPLQNISFYFLSFIAKVKKL